MLYSNTLNKLAISLSISFCFLLISSFSVNAQYFDVRGDWAGNDANGNAVIKWEIEICAGADSLKNLVVAVPATETDEDDSGGVGLADEDSPADDDVCGGYWTNGWSSFRPADYKTSGILLAAPALAPGQCREYIWTTYSKDYDSDALDYDHYVVANWSADGFPDPGFNCPGDGHIDCDSSGPNGGPLCADQIDCDDVATNNYEQLVGLGFDIIDGPNYDPLCSDGSPVDFTLAYVVCHHGQSDYEAGCDKTAPGETGAVDITPDAVTNVIIDSHIASTLIARGGCVDNIVATNPGANQYLDINPAWDGTWSSTAQRQLTLPSSTIPPGVEEEIGICTPSMPECDTIHVFIEWTPKDMEDMYTNSTVSGDCDDTGNINGTGIELGDCQRYWHRPSLVSYEPLNGYQNAGTVGAIEGPPTELGSHGLDPDPEFGDCPETAYTTCAAGPAEDCSYYGIEMCYFADIMVEKTTTMVTPNLGDPDWFDVQFCLDYTNTGNTQLENPQLTDDLIATFGTSSAYILPFVMAPTVDPACVPAPSVAGGGFANINPNYDGSTDVNLLDGMSGFIDPGEKMRVCFTVTIDRGVVGNSTYTNYTTVNAPDCAGVFCVSDMDPSEVMLFSIDVALQKTTSPSTPGPYSLGQTVTFDIEVINQGMEDLQEVEVTDYIPCGYTFPASNSPLWTLNGSNAVTTIPSIPAGTSQTVSIDLVIINCTSTDAYVNVAEVSYMEDQYGRDVSMSDFDSMADNNPGNDPGGTPGTPEDNHVNDDSMDGDGDGITDEDDSDPEEIEVTPCPEMAGEVYVDVNNNGCQEPTETEMVPGVDVTIWECDPATGGLTALVGTVTTGVDGQWSFGGANADGLSCVLDADKQYTASFDIPNLPGDLPGDPYEDYTFSGGTAPAGCVAGEADDVDPATGQAESCFDPDDDDAGDGDDDQNIDAGITPPCESLGGEVFVDTNNNGCQDASETMMVEGVEVTIYECDPATGLPTVPVGTVTTGADGSWSFGGPDATGACALDPMGSYTVSFDLPNQAGDLPGDPYEGYDFSTGMAPATCAAGEADDVNPVTGEGESCYNPSDDDGGDGDDDENIDAGITPPCQDIGGEVFIDDNNNGCQDATETTMVEGAMATIYECDPITGNPVGTAIGSATTGADGSWSFGGMSATGECALDPTATYTVVFDLPNAAGDVVGDPYVGYDFSTGVADATCADGESDDVDPATGSSESCYDPNDDDGGDGDDDNDIDAGISPCETIGGEVFVDINNNGCQDATETMLVEGVEVTIWTCDPITGDPVMALGTSTTGADGQWSFGGADPTTGDCLLDPSQSYTASFDIPNTAGDLPGDPYVGYDFTQGTAGATCAADEPDDVDPATGVGESCFTPGDGDGDGDEDIDAGITPMCESMGGEVFVDINNNGCQDPSETMMVEGVEVTIYECDPVTGLPTTPVGTVTTGADGQWMFGGMDMTTGVCALDPTQTYTVSFDIPNTAGDLPGDPYLDYDFTEGVADATCADGEADDVDPSTGEGESCYDPSDDDGADGDDDNTIDAGITPPCESLGGEVFVDENNNGCQDAAEMIMVEGVEVTIWSCDPVTGDPDNVIGTVTTGADGSWMFGAMDPDTGVCELDPDASYTVSFDLPNAAGDVTGDPYVGYDFSTNDADATCADGEPDDVDPDTGIANDCYDPNDDDGDDGDDDNDIDAGISPCETMGGEVFVDINNNGCQDAMETIMVEGAVATIWSCDPITGDPVMAVGTATTGADGSWSFGGADPTTGDCLLDPDETYTVSFDMPTGAGEAFEGYDLTEGIADAACADGESDDVDPNTGIAESCYDPSDDDGGDGDDDEDIDAAITPPCESIGGEVFVDINNNGCQVRSYTILYG